MNDSENVFGRKLSSRTYYNLLRHGIETKEQVLDAYMKGKLIKLRNIGKISHNEIFDWLDKEIDSKQKPHRFVIKQNKPKPKPKPMTKSQRQFKFIMEEISYLSDEIKEMRYVLEKWTHANYDLHNSINVAGIERKYITNNQ